MMKRTIILSIVISLVCTLIGVNKVFADYTCDILITGEKNEILEGETITYEITARNINAETGIVMFSTLLDYDSDAFECEIESDEGGNWIKTAAVEKLITMARSDLQANADDQVIARIVITAKTGITSGEYEIKLTKMNFAMDNDQSFSVQDQTINLKVAGENNIVEGTTTNNEQSLKNNPVETHGSLVLEIFQVAMIAVAVILILITIILLIKYKKEE